VSVKYAVLSYSTPNIGDDIQSLAAIHLLNNNNIHEYLYVDREKLKSYNGEPVHLVMNGWFMHDLDQFPPSKYITPLFIGFHCASQHHERLIKENIEYFKRFEPIGCRDNHTKNIFHKYNINAYFSGCLTLAFNEISKKDGLIYNVDIKIERDRVNLDCNNEHLFEILHLNKNIISIEHHINDQSLKLNIQNRFDRANELLNLYRNAELVITSRLHCALPCRSFGTNVIFMHNNYNSDPRFKGLEKYINGIDGISKNILDKSTIQKDLIIDIKKELNSKFTSLLFS